MRFQIEKVTVGLCLLKVTVCVRSGNVPCLIPERLLKRVLCALSTMSKKHWFRLKKEEAINESVFVWSKWTEFDGTIHIVICEPPEPKPVLISILLALCGTKFRKLNDCQISLPACHSIYLNINQKRIFWKHYQWRSPAQDYFRDKLPRCNKNVHKSAPHCIKMCAMSGFWSCFSSQTDSTTCALLRANYGLKDNIVIFYVHTLGLVVFGDSETSFFTNSIMATISSIAMWFSNYNEKSWKPGKLTLWRLLFGRLA